MLKCSIQIWLIKSIGFNGSMYQIPPLRGEKHPNIPNKKLSNPAWELVLLKRWDCLNVRLKINKLLWSAKRELVLAGIAQIISVGINYIHHFIILISDLSQGYNSVLKSLSSSHVDEAKIMLLNNYAFSKICLLLMLVLLYSFKFSETEVSSSLR